jgi:probable F420-dependent oxidoreductase
MLTDIALADVPRAAREMEDLGYAVLYSDENRHDPFLPLVLCAEHTSRVELGTSIVVAFPRNPLQVAHVAHDLQVASQGRFVLGLGPQVRAHIVNRFGVAWSRPVDRMREFVAALRAIWSCWNTGEKLDFRGEFHRHTLMTPNFAPQPSPYGPPRVHLAAVGERMSELAGEVADGVSLHPFTTPHYVTAHTRPALRRGLDLTGRQTQDVAITGRVFVITGWTAAERARAADWVRRRVSFYASTPAYRPVLEAHGWGELQDDLNALSKQGCWDDMAARIDAEVLDAFAVTGEPDEIPGLVRARWGELLDEVTIAPPLDPTRSAAVVAAFQDAAVKPVGCPAST